MRLYKTDIIELARYIGLPEELIGKAPSRQIKSYQTDENDLGASWQKIDEILRELDRGVDPETLIEKGMDTLTVHKIVRMVQESEHKRNFAPVLTVGKISKKIQEAREAEAKTI